MQFRIHLFGVFSFMHRQMFAKAQIRSGNASNSLRTRCTRIVEGYKSSSIAHRLDTCTFDKIMAARSGGDAEDIDRPWTPRVLRQT